MWDVGILVQSRVSFFKGHYFVHRLMEEWSGFGLRIGVFEDPAECADVRATISHLDATIVSARHRDALSRCPRVVNGAVTDISKRAISSHLVSSRAGYDGPVIVKTDLNCGGIPELNLMKGRSLMGWPAAQLLRKMPWVISGILEPSAYPVYAHPSEVPWTVWRDRRFVVERFLPERHGDLYCLRQYLFFGDAEINTVLHARSPVVKAKDVVRRETVSEIPETLRAIRRRLGFDYGRFDYVMNGDEAVVFDVNRTPAYYPSRFQVPYKTMAETLARGIWCFIDRPQPREVPPIIGKFAAGVRPRAMPVSQAMER